MHVSYFQTYSLRKKCPYSELRWSKFSFIRTDFASIRIQSECGEMQTRITPNTNTFHTVTFIVGFGFGTLIS